MAESSDSAVDTLIANCLIDNFKGLSLDKEAPLHPRQLRGSSTTATERSKDSRGPCQSATSQPASPTASQASSSTPSSIRLALDGRMLRLQPHPLQRQTVGYRFRPIHHCHWSCECHYCREYDAKEEHFMEELLQDLGPEGTPPHARMGGLEEPPSPLDSSGRGRTSATPTMRRASRISSRAADQRGQGTQPGDDTTQSPTSSNDSRIESDCEVGRQDSDEELASPVATGATAMGRPLTNETATNRQLQASPAAAESATSSNETADGRQACWKGPSMRHFGNGVYPASALESAEAVESYKEDLASLPPPSPPIRDPDLDEETTTHSNPQQLPQENLPEQPEQPDLPEQSEQPDQPEQPEQPEQAGQPRMPGPAELTLQEADQPEQLLHSQLVEDDSSLRSQPPRFKLIIEGNVGSGKSTILRYLHARYGFTTLPEPVDDWTDTYAYGISPLGLMYEDPERWAATFQSHVNMHFLRASKKEPPGVLVQERSLGSAMHVFLAQQVINGNVTPYELKVLTQRDALDHEAYPEAYDYGTLVYLWTTPECAYERLRARARPGEETVNLKLLQDLHQRHEIWLAEVPGVVVLDCTQSFDDVAADLDMLVSQLGLRQIQNPPRPQPEASRSWLLSTLSTGRGESPRKIRTPAKPVKPRRKDSSLESSQPQLVSEGVSASLYSLSSSAETSQPPPAKLQLPQSYASVSAAEAELIRRKVKTLEALHCITRVASRKPATEDRPRPHLQLRSPSRLQTDRAQFGDKLVQPDRQLKGDSLMDTR